MPYNCKFSFCGDLLIDSWLLDVTDTSAFSDVSTVVVWCYRSHSLRSRCGVCMLDKYLRASLGSQAVGTYSFLLFIRGGRIECFGIVVVAKFASFFIVLVKRVAVVASQTSQDKAGLISEADYD